MKNNSSEQEKLELLKKARLDGVTKWYINPEHDVTVISTELHNSQLEGRDKRIKQLELKLAELESQKPAIFVKGRKVVGFNPADGTRIEGEFYAQPKPAAPAQRITEQDAREIAASFYYAQVTSSNEKSVLEVSQLLSVWLASPDGKILLDKLNEHREPEAEPKESVEPVRYMFKFSESESFSDNTYLSEKEALDDFGDYAREVFPVYLHPPVSPNKAEASHAPAEQVAVPTEVTPAMLRAAQLKSELGAYACTNLSGCYELITELFEVMASAAPSEQVAVPDGYVVANKVREALDRKSCPDAFMVIAYEAIVNELPAAPSDEIKVNKLHAALLEAVHQLFEESFEHENYDECRFGWVTDNYEKFITPDRLASIMLLKQNEEK